MFRCSADAAAVADADDDDEVHDDRHNTSTQTQMLVHASHVFVIKNAHKHHGLSYAPTHE